MTQKIKTIVIVLLILSSFSMYGQSEKEKAYDKCKEAIELMDNGDINKSIKLLNEAIKLDPEKLTYSYELAYANYLKEDYKTSIKILEKYLEHPDINERFYQLLGNSYDMSGNSKKAIEKYDAGLIKFPNSGMLFLEKGTVFLRKKEYDTALTFYLKGIEVDPTFPSNYYRACLLYCNSTEKIWGLIYGEIFMNLERNSARTAEISNLLYKTYKDGIIFTSDTSFYVNFAKTAYINIDNIKDTSSMKLPFTLGIYQPILTLAIGDERKININSLDRIRKNFLDIFFSSGNDKKYPNVLFDYQKQIMEAGHLEAYNHWILMKGDENTFDIWQSNNKTKWDNFVKWFEDNGLTLDDTRKFYSGQY